MNQKPFKCLKTGTVESFGFTFGLCFASQNQIKIKTKKKKDFIIEQQQKLLEVERKKSIFQLFPWFERMISFKQINQESNLFNIF